MNCVSWGLIGFIVCLDLLVLHLSNFPTRNSLSLNDPWIIPTRYPSFGLILDQHKPPTSLWRLISMQSFGCCPVAKQDKAFNHQIWPRHVSNMNRNSFPWIQGIIFSFHGSNGYFILTHRLEECVVKAPLHMASWKGSSVLGSYVLGCFPFSAKWMVLRWVVTHFAA